MADNLEEFLKATGGKLAGKPHSISVLANVSTDTRRIQPGDVFFALKGPNFDGHDFVDEAMAKGVSCVVLSEPSRIKSHWLNRATVVMVPDTLRSYGDWARNYRNRFSVPMIAVTGSSGKTTVKELLSHLLSQKYRVLKNIGTENNLVGVPKTIFGLNSSHEVAVLELGTNAPGEIARLAEIASPTMGILTQIGYSHLEGLKSIEGVRKEKLDLIASVNKGGSLILNGDDPNLASVQSATHALYFAGLMNRNASICADHILFHESGTTFSIPHLPAVHSTLLGKHNVINALLAIQCAKLLQVEEDKILAGLRSFVPAPGRLTPRTLEGIFFIDDTYNSNPTSFSAALETLFAVRTSGRKGVVYGDMLELGEQALSLHEQVGSQMLMIGLDYLIGAGKLSQALGEAAVRRGLPRGKFYSASDSAEASSILKRLARSGDSVLVKGSRGMRMEKVFECFTSFSTR